ncbi:MAG: hypothetical protein AAFR12_00140 [Cyanobacteria bacterium J06626_6]
MENSPLQRFALPQIELPNSLDQLANFASQLQTAISAAISHPILAVLTVLLTIALIQIIADLVKRFIKAGLTFVLKLPLMLSQWLWQRVTASTEPTKSAQIKDLLIRLEMLRQEQDHVLEELKQLVSAPSKTNISVSEQPTAPTEEMAMQQTSEATVAD